MKDATLEQAWNLKRSLLDFVFDAEGELAEALETYALEQSRKRKVDHNLMVDAFLFKGTVADKTPVELFVENHPDLTQTDRQLLNQWQQKTFTGLFAIDSITPDGYDLLNWLTDKHYLVKPGSEKDAETMAKLKPGEILLTRLSPLDDTYWMLSTSYNFLGKLGKPKLAVAIGNFKDNHKASLYGDAPDLLEEAWKSVEKYHQLFLDFFGSDEVTMPGYQLNKKMGEFREILAKQQLAAAGIDDSKSLADIVAESGMTEEELQLAAKEAGVDAQTVADALGHVSDDKASNGSKNGTGKSKMVLPQVQLPDHLKKAEQVTVLADPKWGQVFLTTYGKFTAMLEAEDWKSVSGAEKLIQTYLDELTVTTYVWKHLAEQYPQQLETVLSQYLDRPDFKLSTDLDPLLEQHGKEIEPELPEIASVPIHLHNLFEEAIEEVNKDSKAKKAKEKPKKTGFGLR